jgi:four helix bundle protein
MDYAKSALTTRLRTDTMNLALEVFALTKSLDYTPEINVIRNQVIRSASSVAANYRAACRSRSRKEFFSKICIVVEELDEVDFWLELLSKIGVGQKVKLASIQQSTSELLRILGTAKNTAYKSM